MPNFLLRTAQQSAATPPARYSAQTALTTSGALPASGNPALANSSGASTAAAAISRVLGPGLADIQLSDEHGDGVVFRVLEEKAAHYAPQQRVKGVEWRPEAVEKVFVKAAMGCASAVYEPGSAVRVQGMDVQLVREESAGWDGVVKAMGVWRVVEQGKRGGGFLVVAVRGTKGVRDSVVNANGEGLDALDFLGSRLTEGRTLLAHAGFLNAAKALHATVKEHVRKALDAPDGPRHIIFTGHSAGGAVSALLFAKSLSEAADQEQLSPTLSLITFGAPPITSPCLTEGLLAIPRRPRGLVVAFVNEHDLVPRADAAYVESLLELYNSPKPSAQSAPRPSNPLPWQSPPPELWPMGEIVLMREELEELQSPIDPDDLIYAMAGQAVLLMVEKVKVEDFVKMLAYRVDVHRRVEYTKRVETWWTK